MTEERAVLAGGCFWGVQDLIRHRDGVLSTRVGYTGGNVPNATYRNHGTHAEAVEIIFDPARVSYRQILEFFFQIHDPSTRNRQGNDVGTSYRSAIFYTSDEQKRIAEDTIADVDASGLWPGKVVTEVVPAGDFWEAEPEHQDYLQQYPDGYTCHFVRPNWRLPVRADKVASRRSRHGATLRSGGRRDRGDLGGGVTVSRGRLECRGRGFAPLRRHLRAARLRTEEDPRRRGGRRARGPRHGRRGVPAGALLDWPALMRFKRSLIDPTTERTEQAWAKIGRRAIPRARPLRGAHHAGRRRRPADADGGSSSPPAPCRSRCGSRARIASRPASSSSPRPPAARASSSWAAATCPSSSPTSPRGPAYDVTILHRGARPLEAFDPDLVACW